MPLCPLWSNPRSNQPGKAQLSTSATWADGELLSLTIACALAGGLIAHGVAALRRARRSLLGSFWYAHPAYLLGCDDRRVTVRSRA